MKEEWKDIPGYEGIYEISNMGKIKRVKRIAIDKNDRKRTFKEKIMKYQKSHDGYFRVILSKKGKSKTYKISRLVAIAFIPNLNNKVQVNHKNGIKTEDTVMNLEWNTQSENMLHAYKIGLVNAQGENNGRAKLTTKKVIEIKKLLKKGRYTQQEIADKYKVNNALISMINTGKRWGHIKIGGKLYGI